MLSAAVPIALRLQSGFWQCTTAVGGADAVYLAAICNTLSNAFGSILPLVGHWLHRQTGSWRPGFLWPVAVQLGLGRIATLHHRPFASHQIR